MFIVLQIERSQRTGVVGRLMDRLQHSRISEQSLEVMGGRYKQLCWRGASRPDWEEITTACFRYQNRVLLPQGITLPEGVLLEAPALPRFRRAVLIQTACAIAERSKLPLYRRILGIIDDTGAMAAELPLLLRYYSCVRVVSHRTALYARESERMMHELGAPVLVGCEPDSLRDCMLVLSAGSQRNVGIKAPLLCADTASEGFPCISSLQITPPDVVVKACPEDISLNTFAGSLYEFSGVRGYNLVAGQMLCDYRRSSITEAVNAVCSHAQQL